MTAAAAPRTRWRPAAAGDAAFLRQLFASTRAAELVALGADPPVAAAFVAMQCAARDAAYAARHPNAVRRVVEIGANAQRDAIGQVWVDIGPRTLHLLDISLLPAHRAAGIGTALLRGLIDEATRLQRAVQLQVASTNPARRLYARLGFADEPVQEGLYLTMCWRPHAAPTRQPRAETTDEQA